MCGSSVKDISPKMDRMVLGRILGQRDGVDEYTIALSADFKNWRDCNHELCVLFIEIMTLVGCKPSLSMVTVDCFILYGLCSLNNRSFIPSLLQIFVQILDEKRLLCILCPV